MDQSNAGFAALVKEQDFSPRVGAANSPSTHRQRRAGASGVARRERRASRQSGYRKRLSVTPGVMATGTFARHRIRPIIEVDRT